MDDQEAIGDDEFIYRRIPVSQSWYDIKQNEVKLDAFKPHQENDVTGISVSRAKSEKNPHFQSAAEAAAQGPSTKGYFVASLRVGNLRENGIQVIPDPLLDISGKPDNPGHARIPNLTSENRKDERSQSLMALLAHKLVDTVEGPFLP